MKRPILLLSLAVSFVTILPQAQAQKNTAFAITGEVKGNLNWTVLREVNLSNGSLVRNIYIPLSQKPAHVDAVTGNVINAAASNQPAVGSSQSLSAASAYDAGQNRLYFISLFGNELQYIDLNQRELKIFHVENQHVKQFVSRPGEADNITRMAFGSDGYGYALTNGGNHLIRFSTGKNIHITDLGSLKDGKNNGDISVHTQAESWGGDMVADDGGNLYLFTIAGHVFKINPANMTADFLGTIKNLPAPYSVNAAAVDENGQIVVSSSLDANNYYRVDLSTLEASAIDQKEEKVFNASDFANGNFIACGIKKTDVPTIRVKEFTGKSIAVYPNPVKNKTVHVYFNNIVQGKSTIEVAELSGKKVAGTAAYVSVKGQTQTIQLPAAITPGMYVVRVINADKSVFSENIVVE
ncbi:T9SS type A sorting domain-containing protein [Ilyomonas limi]|nr:T9SS type A sorting domain-containing protein [Ilyomonas limi]